MQRHATQDADKASKGNHEQDPASTARRGASRGRLVACIAAAGALAFALAATGCSYSGRSSSASSPTASGSPAPAPADGPSAASPATSEARAGLGTEWGETREAPITEVSFERATPGNPFALATVRYNDRDGMRALTGGQGRRAEQLTVGSGAVTVSLRGEHGNLGGVSRGGQLFVAGRAGERYSIVLENHTPRRFEAVATVDGLDVMDGSGGSFAHRGYVLDPNAVLVIEGFRKNQDDVAAFRFGAVADSYAAETGSTRDVGVIGVALFQEARDARDVRDGREVRRDVGRDSDEDLRRSARAFPEEHRFAAPPPGRD